MLEIDLNSVIDVVAKSFEPEIDPHKIFPDTSYDDLRADEFDRSEIAVHLQEEFGLELDVLEDPRLNNPRTTMIDLFEMVVRPSKLSVAVQRAKVALALI